MEYWYFRFEGTFPEGSPKHICKGIFSSCLVRESNYIKAPSMFTDALKKNKIQLVKIIEHFDVDGDILDTEDEANTFLIEWYKETAQAKEPVFDKWHVFNSEITNISY